MTSMAVVCKCMHIHARTHAIQTRSSCYCDSIKECMCASGYGWEKKRRKCKRVEGYVCLLSSLGSVVGVAMVTCGFLSLLRFAIAEP